MERQVSMFKSTKTQKINIKKLVAAMALCVGSTTLGTHAHAAGLGKLNVLSSLGQPLQAEVDLVSLQKGELESLVARIASPEAFRDAGLEYAASLNNVKFAIERRSNGQPYLRISSTQPVNEPVLDMLIDLSWSSGRLLREYPILLDPPGFASNKTATAPVVIAPVAPSVPVAATPAPPPAVTYAQPAAPALAPVQAPVVQAPAVQPAPPQTVQAQPSRSIEGNTYGPVKPGETLFGIAQQYKPETVSIDQMLVAMYRQNKQAFVNNNMNFLKKGQILKVPSQEEASALTAQQAIKEIRIQTADWNAYRQKLAQAVSQAPAKPQQGATQSAGGKVGSTVQDKVPADSGKDVVKLSKGDAPTGKGDPSGKAAQEKITALQEEVTRRENALKEANSRVKELEKTVADMNKLLALKSGTLAQAQNQAAAAKPGDDKKPADPKIAAKPADAKPSAKPADAKPPETKADTKPADAKVADAKLAETKKPDAVKPLESKPADVKPATPPVVAATEPETSVLDMVMSNAPYVAGLLGLGLAGFGYSAYRKKKSNRTLAELDEGTAADTLAADLRPASQGQPTAGVVDTSGDSSFLTDFDKTGPGIIDTEEVDPLAEADVYMAYGRDTQAEEILKEAMAKDSERHEIPMKLLEIYYNRGSKNAFENVAKELHKSVGESHPLWDKVREMGLKLEPGNSLYGGAGAAALLASGAALAGLDTSPDRTLPARPEHMAESVTPVAGAAPDIDFDFLTDDAGAKQADFASVDFDLNKRPDFDVLTAGAGSDIMDLDFGATTPTKPMSAPDLDLAAASTGAQVSSGDMPDFDLGLGALPGDKSGGMDFPLTAETKPPSGMDFPLSAEAKPSGSSDLDFDFTSSPSSGKAAAVDMPLDLSELSLDLNAPAAAVIASSPPTASAARRPEAQWQSAATKLDLARAYLEIGDKEGAKEILQEVLTLGNADQQKAAKELVAGLA
jgi:pilus assembly protein FimV